MGRVADLGVEGKGRKRKTMNVKVSAQWKVTCISLSSVHVDVMHRQLYGYVDNRV
jgi:hypothetical protein